MRSGIEKHWSMCDAARQLGVPPGTLRSWVHAGRLRSVKLGHGRGGRRVIPESALIEFLERGASPTAAEAADYGRAV